MEVTDIQDNFTGELVTEMATGTAALVSLDPALVTEITQGDEDPVFVTYAIESGWSVNRRYWPPEVLTKIAEQVNQSTDPVVGYRGHIPPAEDGFSFPEIGLHWLKATTQISSDKSKLFVKAYALPGTKAREYIKRKLAKTISVSGKALLKPIKGGVAVSDFDLESIDLARPRTAGMKTQLVAVTQEMEDDTVKPEEIAALQENELRAHNPGLVTSIETEAKKPLETKISEMETEAENSNGNADLLTKIREALGIDENADILAIVGETVGKLKQAVQDSREKMFDEVLEKKFKNENTRNLVRRLAVSEMQSEDTEEMDEDKYREHVEKRVTEMIENDADLKALASEHETGGGRSLSGGTSDRAGKNEGPKTNENIEVSKAGAGRR